ncbi:hypothetical protein AB0941_38550 [Streptomyces sp. NPDC013433]|uniref:hypothetical protein n=1 Tax=Streptomyces sp. NPDC013433 TaxID=3155604 RepID=UPI00345275C4
MALTALSGCAFSQHPSTGAEGRAVTGAPAAVPVDGGSAGGRWWCWWTVVVLVDDGGATTGTSRELDTSTPAG